MRKEFVECKERKTAWEKCPPQIPTYNETLTAIAVNKRFEGFSNLEQELDERGDL